MIRAGVRSVTEYSVNAVTLIVDKLKLRNYGGDYLGTDLGSVICGR